MHMKNYVKCEKYLFSRFPAELTDFCGLNQAMMKTPFDTAYMTFLALCMFKTNPRIGIEMLSYVRGTFHFSEKEKAEIRTALDGEEYIPYSFFEGAYPYNNYQPLRPYKLEICEMPYSFSEDGYAKLAVQSSGAEEPRTITLRQKNGRWFFWDQDLLGDIIKPALADSWTFSDRHTASYIPENSQ